MRLGLEGMTPADIDQMDDDFAEEDAAYLDDLVRHRDRFLSKQKRGIYGLMGRIFGCGYEEAFRSGHFCGVDEGRRQMMRDLKRLSREELLICFGHKVEP